MKQSYTVPCSTEFRNQINRLAESNGVNAADVARAIMLLVPQGEIAARADPGEPGPSDRETVLLKSGPAAGRPWRRKPRLQVRMRRGLDPAMIRKALAIALDLDRRTLRIVLDDGTRARMAAAQVDRDQERNTRLAEGQEEIDRLRAMVSVLAFDPLPNGVVTEADAMFVLGFPPSRTPTRADVRGRYRLLAAIHHPDSPYGDHERMSQINSAADLILNRA